MHQLFFRRDTMPITFSHGHGFHPWVKAPIPTQLIAVYHSFLRVDNVSGLQVLRTYHREYIIVFFKSKSSHRLNGPRTYEAAQGNTPACPHCGSYRAGRSPRKWFMRLAPGSKRWSCHRCYKFFLSINPLFNRTTSEEVIPSAYPKRKIAGHDLT